MPCFVQVGINGRIINLSKVVLIEEHTKFPGTIRVYFAVFNHESNALQEEWFEGEDANALRRYLEANTEMFVVAE